MTEQGLEKQIAEHVEYRNFSTTKKKVLEWGLNRIIQVIENTKA